MPEVDFDLPIKAPIDVVWRTVADTDSYAAYMENVLSAKITSDDGAGNRLSSWSILLKGAILQWEEREEVDHENRQLRFWQTDGDMETLEGYWHVRPVDDEVVSVRLFITFRIGIPLLADMLDPLARQAIHDNSQTMLLAIERRAGEPMSSK
jgi:ribosome-associated toxin RatA of RatAB toxin-antitoxin module